MTITRILLDMDEVLTDFVGSACQAWGISSADALKHWPAGQWSMVQPVGDAVGRPELTFQQLWDRINGNEVFWAGMQATPYFQDILTLVRRAVDDHFRIVTAGSPYNCPTCYSGKVKWIHRKFGQQFDQFAIYPYKWEFAKPGVVLIDDRETTCEKFREHGGHAILFPQWHNSLHQFRDNPVAYVAHELERISKL